MLRLRSFALCLTVFADSDRASHHNRCSSVEHSDSESQRSTYLFVQQEADSHHIYKSTTPFFPCEYFFLSFPSPTSSSPPSSLLQRHETRAVNRRRPASISVAPNKFTMQDTIQSRRKSEKILWLTLSDLIDVRAFFHPSKMVPPPPLSDEQVKPASLKSEWSPSPSTSSSSSSPIFTSSGQISEEEEYRDIVYASTSTTSSNNMTNIPNIHSTLVHRQNHFLRLPPRQRSSFRTNWNSDNSDDSEGEEDDDEDEVEQSGSSSDDDDELNEQDSQYEDVVLPRDYLAQALPTLSYAGTHNWSPSYSTRQEASSP